MSVLSDIKMVLTLKCDESSRLLSDELDRPLRSAERIALRLHLLGCRACRRARRCFAHIQDILRRMGVMQQRCGNGQQVVFMLQVDLAQSLFVPSVEFRYQTLIFQHQKPA